MTITSDSVTKGLGNQTSNISCVGRKTEPNVFDALTETATNSAAMLLIDSGAAASIEGILANNSQFSGTALPAPSVSNSTGFAIFPLSPTFLGRIRIK
jgi:hypothetical protein